MNLTLDSLVASMEKQAGIVASPTADQEGQTKQASVASVNPSDDGAALADAVMQKVAGLQSTSTKETNSMNKQASVAGKALADALLVKLANAGDVITQNGIPGGVVPNKNQVDVAQTVAEQDGTIKPMPTGDGQTNQGTINQIFDSIVADAMGQGAASYDQVHTTGVAGAEGAVEGHAVPNQVGEDEVEKTAAVIELVNSGYDFDSAVDMVKSAAAQIEYEEGMQVKQAALNSLLDRGVDFDTAVHMVKSAGVVDTALNYARGIPGKISSNVGSAWNGTGAYVSGIPGKVSGGYNAAVDYAKSIPGRAQAGYHDAVGFAKGLPEATARNAGNARDAMGNLYRGTYADGSAIEGGRLATMKYLAQNPVVQGAGALGAAGAVGGGAYYLGREKQAAVAGLVNSGVDFDDAVSLVQSKSMELYGQ